MMMFRLKRRQKDEAQSEGWNENKEADRLQVPFWTEHRTFIVYLHTCIHVGLPWRLYNKKSAHNARAPGSIPGSGRPPGEENGNPLQYSCLENPMDRGVWQAGVHGVAKSWT